MKIFYDTETCGFAGVPVLIQYATDEDPAIKLHHIWREPFYTTMKLIEWFMDNEVVGFNLAFDHFQLCKIYTMFAVYLKNHPEHKFEFPEEHIADIAKYEREAMDGPCLKPKSACDLMLVARKGKYQVTMERSDIRIRRVPTVIAWDVAKELEKRILFDPILFAKQKNPAAPRWQVRNVLDKRGELVKDFKDIVLKFRASSGLKALAVAACDVLPDDVIHFQDVMPDPAFTPDELEYAPFADAVKHEFNRATKRKGKGKRRNFMPWPTLLEFHIRHWGDNKQAQKYAADDVIYTRELYKALGSPTPGDVDSTLACCVAAVRWRGYEIDVEGIEKLLVEARKQLKKIPTSTNRVKDYLNECLTPDERSVLSIVKTGKLILQDFAQSNEWKGHPIQQRAQDVLDAREAAEEIKLYKKLLIAKRLHFGVKVIGALSSRMSGDNKLNPQGIKNEKKVRSKFFFARNGMVFYGGDFDSFEVSIADAVYNDPALRAVLLRGEKIHTLFAMSLFPDKTKEDILASKGSSFDMYDMGKRGVFALIYGGNENTLVTRLGVSKEIADAAVKRWLKTYPGIAKARQKIIDRFGSMKQPGGIGTRIEWHEPDEFVSSLLGHRRYFTLENRVCKELYNLANKPLDKWKRVEGKVVRRERTQSIGGAVMSALFACAFQIQSSMTRQAGNHEIQSTGAEITKDLQRNIWNIQPHGVNEWQVQPCNIHDEVLCPVHPNKIDEVAAIVNATVEKHRATVPLIGLEWKQLNTWADK